MEAFHSNPTRHPSTNKKITIGSEDYIKLTDKYGDVKITSFKTGRKIALGKGQYKQLLKDGYTEKELLKLINITKSPKIKLTKVKSPKAVSEKTEQVIPNDVLPAILMDVPIQTIASYLRTNKYATQVLSQKDFWINKFNKDNLPIIEMQSTPKNWIKEYRRVRQAVALDPHLR